MDSFAARDACKRGDFDSVLSLYHGSNPDQTWTCWDYYYYALALRKTRHYARAREISRAGMVAFPDFVNLRSIYCWCLYYLYIQKFNGQEQAAGDFRRAAASILKYSRQEKYSPYEKTIWRLLAYLKTRPGQTAEMAKYLRLLDPDQLSAEPRTFTSQGKERTVASDREKWYSLASRFLVKEGHYDECIRRCEEALRIFPELHHDNEIWFAYRIALCKLRKGETEAAKEQFTELLKYKQHWILQRGLFFVAQAERDESGMRKYGASALLLPGAARGKVNFIAQFAKALSEMPGYEKAAYAHYLFAAEVRTAEGWQIRPELSAALSQFHYQRPSRSVLDSYLHTFWLEEKHAGETPHTGKIEKLLPGGKAGFLKEYTGGQYYFRTSSLYHVPLEEGAKVQFYIEEFFQSGKEQPARRAVDIVSA